MNGKRIGDFSIAIAAGFAAPLAVIAPNALAPLMIVAGLGALFAKRWPARPWLIGVGAFLAFALLSLLWTIDAAEGFDGWVRITFGAVLGLALVGTAASLDEAARSRIARWLAIGMFSAIVLLAMQFVSQRLVDYEGSIAGLWYGPDTNFWALFNRSVATLAILLPLAAMAAYRTFGRAAALGLLAAGIFIVLNFNSQGAEYALVAATLAAIFVALLPKRGAFLLSALLAVGVLAAPLIASAPQFDALAQRRDISPSVFHRAAIWSFAAERIFEKPAFGWGMHASRAIPGAKRQFAPGAELMPLHPHNAALQLWLELGLSGAFAGAALMLALGRRIRGDAPTRAALAATLGAAVVIAGVGYGLWQGWWMAALWIIVALAAALASKRDGC
ncbi:MAG: O-antigen ligase family protein [Alphaproteobacteria bacterium]|nr:O-antigen ligase family protein [Alphaproteobacteria bacterium]